LTGHFHAARGEGAFDVRWYARAVAIVSRGARLRARHDCRHVRGTSERA